MTRLLYRRVLVFCMDIGVLAGWDLEGLYGGLDAGCVFWVDF